jgi:hypothetical protein
MIIGSIGSRASAGKGGNPLLLDTYSGAAAAYSLRKLNSSYSGSAIRVRRSSDNTESDIGFTSSGDLNESALLSFVGSGNGFVHTWYDQSGNGFHVSQTTNANQPRIVNAGVVEKVDSNASIFYDGTNDFLRNTSVTMQIRAVHHVTKSTKNSGVQTIVRHGNESADVSTTQFFRFENAAYLSAGGANLTFSASTSVTPSNKLLGTSLFDSSSLSQYINGVAGSVDNVGTTLGSNTILLNIGQHFGAEYFQGRMLEIIIYPSDQSTNRTAIESNINTYYSIY